jgi:hypothetical protein
MPWNAIQMPDLLAAMALCDQIGPTAFRTAHSPFHPAKDLHMYYGARGPYEARPLIAGAYANTHPNGPHIGPTAFEGKDAHTFLIQRFGFEANEI